MVRHPYEKDPKRDPNLENYPKENMSKPLEAPTASGRTQTGPDPGPVQSRSCRDDPIAALRPS